MSSVYILDVNGTLTPPGQPIEPEMLETMKHFLEQFPTYLVDEVCYQRLRKQLPNEMLVNCAGVFGCAGSEFWQKGKLVYSLNHEFDHDLLLLCQHFVDASPYPDRYGNHIYEQPGSLVVSVVGSMANEEQQAHYRNWDKQTLGRKRMINTINSSAAGYWAAEYGNTEIVITPSGWDKARIMQNILGREPGAHITFFGDNMSPGGNDMPLAQALKDHSTVHSLLPVINWQNTLTCLHHLLENKADASAA